MKKFSVSLCALLFLSVCFLIFGISSSVNAFTITKSADYTLGGIPGGGVPQVDQSSATEILTVDPGDVPLGDLISDVNLRVNITKSGLGINDNGDFSNFEKAFIKEIVMRLTSPSGTTVNLINEGTYNGNQLSVRATLVLDDSAASAVGGDALDALKDGTFRPVEMLGNFIDESPIGNWTIFFQDTNDPDPLSLNSWSLNITTTAIPEPNTLFLFCPGLIGLAGFRRRFKKS